MTKAICGVNASCYPVSTEASSSSESAGGAPSTSQANGAEGAGNVEKTGEPEASLRCLPELAEAAKDCGKAFLMRSVTGALVCGLKLEALRRCLTSEPSK
jgi:hypothetical protein